MAAMKRSRAAAIIVSEHRVALIKREHSERGRLYYLFPGGGLENGESYEEAVVREVLEETGLEVAVERLVAVVQRLGNPQYHFLVHIEGGNFGSGNGPEMAGEYDSSRGSYQTVWIDVADMLKFPVYPRCVGQIIVDSVACGWPSSPVRCVDDS